MNVRSMMGNVRVRCGDPRAQKPSNRTLLLLLSSQIQNFVNEANLTGRAWAVDELFLSVSGSTEDYQLPINSRFGKPILVRGTYPANPGLIERNIDFIELGEFNMNWDFPKNFGNAFSYDGSPNNAERLAFFRKAGTDQVWVRVLPIPQQSADYQILYQIGVYGETVPLEETPLIPEHHGLIEVRTAINALPHCEWDDDAGRNADKRKELALTLADDRSMFYRLFKQYIATTSASVRPTYRNFPTSID